MTRSPVVKRSNPPFQKYYSDYKENLRIDFWFSCAYCDLPEFEVRKGFDIDHYIPESQQPALVNLYCNLVWGCFTCNHAKTDYLFRPDAAANGIRFYRPDVDNPLDHFEAEKSTGTIIPKTPIGRHTISILYLNRKLLQKVRLERRRRYKSKQAMLMGIKKYDNIPFDRLPKAIKLQIVKIREEIHKEAKIIEEEMDNFLLKRINADPAFDPDSISDSDVGERKKYLREIKATYPGPWLARQLKKKKR